jgi:release factor glutamine methyltransferase
MHPPNVRLALEIAREALSARGEEARRDAGFLLAGVLGLAPGALALAAERRLSADEWRVFEARLARRARGEPLQYIEGRAAFRHLNLRVDRSVLIPRPETEQLVELVLERCRGREALAGLDLGTGSGAIAISLALEGPFQRVVGVDISAAALNVARVNVAEAGLEGRVDLRLGSLFGTLGSGERFHVVVANPPYVAGGEAGALSPEVRDWEPAVALFAGPTGLEVIEEIVVGAADHLEEGGILALEVAPGLAAATAGLVRAVEAFRQPEVYRDLAGHERMVIVERR